MAVDIEAFVQIANTLNAQQRMKLSARKVLQQRAFTSQ